MLHTKSNRNKGFSFLEVAIVLVIIALIASTTLPKIQGTLKSGSVSVASMAGEFDNAVRQARAQWFSNGQSGVVRIEGFADGQVWSGNRGWPVGYSSSEPPTSLSANSCAGVWNGVMRGEGAPRVSTDSQAQWKAQAGTEGVCQYVAQLDPQPRIISYNTKSGKVSYQ